MYEPVVSVSPTPEKSHSYTRAEALEVEITELCAHINAASYRLLQLVAALDDEAPWGAWGLISCAHWLNWRCGIGFNAAREKVRVAHALKPLARISASFATGELSFSKVRALTRIANADNEAELLDLARYATAAQLEKLVRAYRRVGHLEECERATAQHTSRELTCYYDDDGSLVIRARLPPDEGAVVLQALNAAMDAQQRDTQSDDVTAETLALDDSDGRCELDDGQRLAPDTVRRLACDGSLLHITEDSAGNPLDIGRKTRAVPPALRRALQARDAGCRFPGCSHRRFVDAHHIEHWADGGRTSIDNLVLLCRRHHRLVHEGGFGLVKIADGRNRFTRPDGRAIDDHPRLPGGTIGALCCGNQQSDQAIVVDHSN